MFGNLLGKGSGVVAPVDLTQGLVAHYLLNNNADDSNGVYDGTPSGGVDFQGDVANLDGVDDFVNTIPPATLATTDSITISMWARKDNTTTTGQLFNGRDDYYLSVGTFILKGFMNLNSSGFLNVLLRDNANTELLSEASFAYNSNQLYHIVYTFDNTTKTQKVYVDGVLLPNYTKVGTGTTYSFTDAIPYIGRQYYHGPNEVASSYFGGNISNTRIYNEAKDQAFIDALFAEGYYPKPLPLPTTTGLVAHYPLTGTAEDTTGNYDGIEEGGLSYTDDAEFGSVANFDGLDDNINIGTIPIDTSLQLNFGGSISFWHTPDVVGDDYGRIIDKSDGGNGQNGWFIYINNTASEIIFSAGDALGALILEYQFNISSYVGKHTCFTFVLSSDKIIKLFANNNEILAEPTPIATSMPLNVATNMRIGTWNHSTGREMSGKLHNVRFYNSILTTQEITDIYNYEKNFRPIDIDNGLVAYYPLSNNSLDNYNNEYDGTDTDMTYDGLSGVFNGTTSKVSLDALGLTSEVSISLWVKVDTLATEARPFGYSQVVENNMFILRVDPTYLAFYTKGTTKDGNAQWSTTPTVSTWYHLVGTAKNNGSLELYVDGALKATDTTDTWDSPSATLFGAYIGCSRNGDLQFVDGNIANVRVYNKAITAEQVEVIYNTEKGDFA